jgi:hypothetical protein
MAGLLAGGCSGGAAPHRTAAAPPSGTAYPTGKPVAPAGPPPSTLAGYYAQTLRWPHVPRFWFRLSRGLAAGLLMSWRAGEEQFAGLVAELLHLGEQVA